VEEVTGDLEEKFYRTLESKPLFKAKANYWYQTMHYMRPFAIRKRRPYYSNQYEMFRNNLRIAVRSLWKKKASSVINAFGLTIGLTSCLLIGLYIQHELSFDKFQEKRDRIARVIMEYSFDGSPEAKRGNFTSTKVAPVFVRTFPEVESAVRMTDADIIVQHGDQFITEQNFMFADSSFFDVFTFNFIEGNPEHALDGPKKVVLTRSSARKYFGNDSPLGKSLLVGTDKTPYQITGVMDDYPSNSQIRFDFLASFSSLGVNQEVGYFDANYTTYLLLQNASNLTSLQPKVTSFMKKEMSGTGASINYILEAFADIHLTSEYPAFVPNNSVAYLYILGGVALLILTIVCFTYINLSTAKSIERAKEVGIRKVVGAAKIQLFWQFISEAGILSVVSVMLSLGVAVLLLPWFNLLTQRQLEIHNLFSPAFILFAMGITFCVSMLAGSYPALVLSGLQPIKVLKGVFKNTASGKWVQQSLIVFQFAISAFLIASTMIIQKQLHFIQNKKLGFDREHVLVLPMDNKLRQNIPVIKQQLKNIPHVLSVSAARSTPAKIVSGHSMRSTTMPDNEEISVAGSPIDEDFIKTTGLQIIAGRDLTEQDMRDVSSENFEDHQYHFILNESAARQLGWSPGEAIGKKMFMGLRAGTIEGVVRNFHFESMHTAIKPLVLFTEHRARHLIVKVDGIDLNETIVQVETKWKELIPQVPFEYQFLDDEYNDMYRAEIQLGVVMKMFAAIAIVLACLGLLGLSSYIVQQRMKEIAIRKVLGASILNIVNLLSGRFTKLVFVSILVASPAAYFAMYNWLQDFAYRIEIEWTTFIMVALFSLAIALLTVSVQSIKAAVTNPVDSMRSE
jgi:putative ABC transport system permease protein